MTVPIIPESAPFSSEQRAWLNGFFAGIFSTASNGNGAVGGGETASTAAAVAPAVAAAGAAEETFPWHDPALLLPERLTLAEGKPIERRLMAAMAQLDCGACGYLCKTYSEAIARGEERDLTRCTPGGSDTAKALKKLLAARDSEAGPTSGQNGHAASPAAVNGQPQKADSPAKASSSAAINPSTEVGGRNNPVRARLVESIRLTHLDAPRDTRHVILDLLDSGVTYEPGDSLGVLPENCPELVQAVLDALGASGEELVCVSDISPRPLREWLGRDLALNRLQSSTVECLAAAATDPAEADALVAILNADPENFLGTADVVDTLRRFPSARPPLAAFVASLGRLQPRLYSISSSLRVHPGQVHLTVGVVRFESQGRWRNGTTSHFLGVRANPGDTFPVFIQRSSKFRLPENPDTPVVMVGPGTGIAPFRAFLHEREATGAKGRNWLFFGNQYIDLDFLYRKELDGFLDRGVLTRLEIAFSRDTAKKVYVQDRMLEQASELWHWLEQGAYFYVCGDAKRMARDVDQMLYRVVAEQGRRSQEEAKRYVSELAKANRYHRDVY
jgi:sulfite reductase (NADPH) flavoprotein alpha-component